MLGDLSILPFLNGNVKKESKSLEVLLMVGAGESVTSAGQHHLYGSW